MADAYRTDELAEWMLAQYESTTGKTRGDASRRRTFLTPLIVVLKMEAGMTAQQIADELGCSVTTVGRYWQDYINGVER